MSIILQLGDIIKISHPSNDMLNDQSFVIDYIDKEGVDLFNISTQAATHLTINDETIGDGNISQIEILSRADTPSYARQNGLLPGKWINVYFGGDIPAVIAGQITNLEEDLLELTTSDGDVIYINFDYKGIPKDLPIELIELRKPLTKEREVVEQNIEEVVPDSVVNPDVIVDLIKPEKPTDIVEELEEENVLLAPFEQKVPRIRDKIKETIVRADQIVFGHEDLGKIVQFVDVSSKSQRYSLETQLSDLLDDLLSTVPTANRTPSVLNDIHIQVERFKQLRQHFSTFDQYGNVESMLKNQATFKPLIAWLKSLDRNLFWIVPVVKSLKTIYTVNDKNFSDVGLNLEENDEKEGATPVRCVEDLATISRIQQGFKNNEFTDESYKTMLREIDRRFNMSSYTSGTNIMTVGCDLNTVVEYSDDMVSTVFTDEDLMDRRFVVNRYIQGSQMLQSEEMTGAKMIADRINATPDEEIDVKSFLMLPEPVMRFSKLVLPGTDLFQKANLNYSGFLNYWQLLKQKTVVYSEERSSENWSKKIVNYPVKDTDLDAIVPKTRTLFRLMKKYIRGKLSVVNVVSYLEPFLVYTDNLTFKQYLEIVRFINDEISSYNKNVVEMAHVFKMLQPGPPNNTGINTVYEILEKGARENVIENTYKMELEPPKTVYYSSSEILKSLVKKDYMRHFNASVSSANHLLLLSKSVDEFLGNNSLAKDANLNKDRENNKENGECNTITIAKLYNSVEQLEKDNGKLVYFDKRYDKTFYGLMEDDKDGYGKVARTLVPEKLKEHIVKDQMEKKKKTVEDAEYLADTLINGVKRVLNGQYAVLFDKDSTTGEENDILKAQYFQRVNDVWTRDQTISPEMVSDDSAALCNLRENCSYATVEEKCMDKKTAKKQLQNAALNNMMKEFDIKYQLSKEQLEQQLKFTLEFTMQSLPIILEQQTGAMLKYNLQKYGMARDIDQTAAKLNEVSPFKPALDLILGLTDFTVKQAYIVKFADKFTRSSLVSESEHWLYCLKTGAELLPAFKKELAAAFCKSPYLYGPALDKVKSTIGQLSDDGDWWTDKHTGWPICPGDFDTDEGYTDGGFKANSRSIMEEDAGSKIIAPIEQPVVIKYTNPTAIMTNNIVNALSVAMGINLESQKEFIINSVKEALEQTVENEVAYNDKVKLAAQKGKALMSYKDFFNSSLLYLTLGAYLVACQTCIPSIKTRKTHPGCVKSFAGYPFEGQGNMASITYLSCVAFDIRESGQPWNTLKRQNSAKIQEKIQFYLDKILLIRDDVKRKMAEKTDYLLNNNGLDKEIPLEHDISLWSEFLPPLKPFTVKNLSNITSEFKKSLVQDLKSGKADNDGILTVETKIQQYSLAIVEAIQNVVKKNELLLHSATMEPYLENACCQGLAKDTTIGFFVEQDKNIREYNLIVQDLANVIDDIQANTKSVIFCSGINTKNVYPLVPLAVNEPTIYKTFIHYCHFKSVRPVPPNLTALCAKKPDLQNGNDLTVKYLRENGFDYDNHSFQRLVQLVSKTVNTNTSSTNALDKTRLIRGLLEAMEDEDRVEEDEMVDKALQRLLSEYLFPSNSNKDSLKNLNNYLALNNKDMKAEVMDFVRRNSAKISGSKMKQFMDNMNETFSKSGGDAFTADKETLVNTNFFKTGVHNFVNVFPNCILNKVKYGDVSIAKYHGFTKSHELKLKQSVKEYFESLEKFYDTSVLHQLLNAVKDIGFNMVILARLTPLGRIPERTASLLYEYYLLKVMLSYTILAEREDFVQPDAEKNDSIDLHVVNKSLEENVEPIVSVKELKIETAELLTVFMEMFMQDKELVDTSYADIQEVVFKLKEKEKNRITDKLKGMSDERRDADTMMKVIKQGEYAKGTEKGLTKYDSDYYESEADLRHDMMMTEKRVKERSKKVNNDTTDLEIDEALAEQELEREIEADNWIVDDDEDYSDGDGDGDYAAGDYE